MSNPPQDFGELDSLLEIYPRSKKQHSFLKKQKILFSILNKDTFECWNMNMQLQNLKSSKYFISAW